MSELKIEPKVGIAQKIKICRATIKKYSHLTDEDFNKLEDLKYSEVIEEIIKAHEFLNAYDNNLEFLDNERTEI